MYTRLGYPNPTDQNFITGTPSPHLPKMPWTPVDAYRIYNIFTTPPTIYQCPCFLQPFYLGVFFLSFVILLAVPTSIILYPSPRASIYTQ